MSRPHFVLALAFVIATPFCSAAGEGPASGARLS
jgi:hypothetical protein